MNGCYYRLQRWHMLAKAKIEAAFSGCSIARFRKCVCCPIEILLNSHTRWLRTYKPKETAVVGSGPTDAHVERSQVGTWAHYKDWTVVQRVAHLGMESSGEVAFSAGLVRHASTHHWRFSTRRPSYHPKPFHCIFGSVPPAVYVYVYLHRSPIYFFCFIFHLYKKYIVYTGWGQDLDT